MALLSRRSPFGGLQQLEQRLDDLFGEMGGDGESVVASAWRPVVDIFEQGDSIVVECELPGVERDKIDIQVEDDRLTIRGERREETKEEDEERDYYRSERRFESFQRVFSLPGNVDREAIEANLEDGVLRIVMPETEASKAQRIAIE